MPAEQKRNSHTHIRFRNSTDDTTFSKRARGEISCAECRRLKLKCDRKIPCGSCNRRGCASICPQGSLTAGQGTRHLVQNGASGTNKKMGDRIKQLEEALAELQAKVSSDSHPLLHESLLNIKDTPETPLDSKPGVANGSSADLIHSVGTLTIGDHGEAQYFGRSAGTEPLFLAAAEMAEPQEDVHEDCYGVHGDVIKLSNMFPVAATGSWDVDHCLDLLLNYLPEQSRAWSLCETYFEQAAWTASLLNRDDLIHDILSPIYKALTQRDARPNDDDTILVSPHKLAALFMVFGLGTLVDLTVDSHSSDADKYYHLSRAALSLQSILESPEIVTIQTLMLLGSFINLGGKRDGIDSTWTVLSIAAKLSQSVGLHRDCARWNLDPKIVQTRRHLFWEIYFADMASSIALGRPPSFNLAHVDCEYPEDLDPTVDKDGNKLMSYDAWRYRFVKDVFTPVIETVLATKPPSYAYILELDRKIRAYALPPHLNKPFNPSEEDYTPSKYMRGCLLPLLRILTLLYLHRSYFTQALLDFPSNPLNSPYAPSYLAAYQCGSWIINSNVNHFSSFPDLIARFSTIWTHLFTASIIVGATTLRSPTAEMSSSAFREFRLAADLFEKGAKVCQRARNGLGLIRRLRERLTESYQNAAVAELEPQPGKSVLSEYGGNTLAMFGGQTRVMMSKLSNGRKTRKPSQSSTPSPGPNGASPEFPANAVHPALMEFLSFFPQPDPAQDTTNFPFDDTAAIALDSEGFPQYDPPLSSSYNWNMAGSMEVLKGIPGLSTNSGAAVPENYAPRFAAGASQMANIPNEAGQPMDFEAMFSVESGTAEPWVSFMHNAGLLGESGRSSL